MSQKLKSLIFLILIGNLSFAQLKSQSGKSILIYSDENGYMQPFIEKTLKELINTETDGLYFTDVNSFNRFISDNKYQAELNDLILTQKPSNIKLNTYYTESEKKIKERIFNILKNYNYFLSVKTNTLGELIEIQFQLFETVVSDNSSYNISDKVLGVENFFINPKEKDYSKQITNALKRLFKNSNKIPEVELKIYNKVFTANSDKNEMILPINSKIILDGSNSGDHDTEEITFIWRNIISKNQKYQTVKKIEFKDNSSSQEIVINTPGTYTIGFKAFDGIDYSKEIIIVIHIKKKPKEILIFNNVTHSKSFKAILSKNSSQVQYGKLYFDTNQKDSLLNKIILSKEIISQQTVNDVDDNLFVKPLKIRNGNLFNGSYIEFESTFNNLNTNEEKEYYLYSLDSDGFLHDEKVIKHIYSTKIIDFRQKFYVEMNDLTPSNTSYFSLAAGILLMSNVELEFSVPIQKRINVSYNGYQFTYPNKYEVSLNYLLSKPNLQGVGSIIPFLGINYKGYKITSELSKSKSELASFGLNLGIDYKIKSLNILDLNTRFYCSYNMFSGSTFKNVKSLILGFGTIIKI